MVVTSFLSNVLALGNWTFPAKKKTAKEADMIDLDIALSSREVSTHLISAFTPSERIENFGSITSFQSSTSTHLTIRVMWKVCRKNPKTLGYYGKERALSKPT